jgi:hypothetical protein
MSWPSSQPLIRREVLPPRRVTSPAGAILLSTSTMLLAIAASTLLLRDRAFPPGSKTLSGAASTPLSIRPATPCHASRHSFPLQPPSETARVVRSLLAPETKR